MISLKRANRSSILRLLCTEGSLSRKRLAASLKLTPAAITKITSEMIEEGLLEEGQSLSTGSKGRREIELKIKPNSVCALGMFINLQKAVISVVNLSGDVLVSEEIPLEANARADETVEMLCARLLSLKECVSGKTGCVLGTGIAVRGILSSDHRTVCSSFGALDTENYPLAKKVEEYTGLPAVMENNVRALFFADSFLSKSVRSSSFFLRCEYGIGAAMSINGEIWHGFSEQCAEIGHIQVVSKGGRLCSCGKHGCLETVASPNAIMERSAEALSARGEKLPDDAGLDYVFNLAKCGDPDISEIVINAVISLASALKSVIYIADPEEIVLYGRMFDNDYCLSMLSAEMGRGVDSRHKTKITKSSFNRLLEDRAAGLVMINDFYENGGIIM